MSEQHEPDEPQEPAEDAPGPSDDEQSEEEAAEQEQANTDAVGQTTPVAAPPMDAAKEQRRIASALEREHKAHGAKLEKILGEAHEHVLPCPLCFEGLQGYVFPQDGPNLSDEARAAALAFLDASDVRELNPAKGVRECDVCDGWGKLAYPGKVPHVQEQNCPKCNGQGYVTDEAQQATPLYVAPPPTTGTNAAAVQVPACPLCGMAGMAGQPHFCNPASAAGGA